MNSSNTTNAKPACLGRLVRASDLKFRIDRIWPERSTWLQRWIARKCAAHILNNECRTYQFGGWTGDLRKSYELVDADKEQLAHWILRNCGYECCPADLMKLTGHNPEARSTNTPVRDAAKPRSL